MKKYYVVVVMISFIIGNHICYDSFFRLFVKKHETEIDNNLLNPRAKGGEIVFLSSKKVVIKFFKILVGCRI